MSAEPLRRKAVRAGVHLTLRRIVGLVLGFVGLLYLTRIIGPEAYGAYAAATGVLGYFLTVGNQGGRIFLIRQPEGVDRDLFDLTFWWLLGLSIGVGILLIGVGLGLLTVGSREAQFATVLAATAGTLALGLTRGVPAALLERNLDYGKLAIVEITGQLLFYAVGIPLAWQGAGVWALIAAYWVSEVVQTLWLFGATRYAPRWYWNRATFQESLRESLKMSAGAWMYELRRFGVPLVLLPLAGERAVGYYALAERLVGSLTFVSSAISQLSVPVYSKLQERLSELMRAIYLSAQAQLLGFGAFALVAVLGGQVFLPVLLGNNWDSCLILLTTAALCVHTLFFIIFGAQAQAMYVKQKAGIMLQLSVITLVYMYPFILALTYLIPEPYKPVGFVGGIFIAHQFVHWHLHRAVCLYLAQPIYGVNLIWGVAISAALFAPFTHYLSLGALLVFLHPASVREVRKMNHLLQELRPARREDKEVI